MLILDRLRRMCQPGRHEITDTDKWSLRDSMAEFLAPRLRFMSENVISYPYGLTPEKWREKLAYMAEGFDLLAREGKGEVRLSDAQWEHANRAVYMFGQFFWDLWD